MWQMNFSATKMMLLNVYINKINKIRMTYQLNISHISTEMLCLFAKCPNFSLCPECLHWIHAKVRQKSVKQLCDVLNSSTWTENNNIFTCSHICMDTNMLVLFQTILWITPCQDINIIRQCSSVTSGPLISKRHGCSEKTSAFTVYSALNEIKQISKVYRL